MNIQRTQIMSEAGQGTDNAIIYVLVGTVFDNDRQQLNSPDIL